MSGLSQEQQDLRQSIQKSAMIWAVIFGVVIAAILYWALGGQGAMIRAGGAVVGGVVLAAVIFKWRFGANSDAAKCANCNAAFSITRTDHAEVLASSQAKETREAQEDYSTKVTTWVEEEYDVTDTYTCAKCDDITTKAYKTTRRKDEKEEVEPAPVKEKPAEVKDGGDKGDAKDGGKKSAPSKAKSNSTKSAGPKDTPKAPQDGGTKS